MHHRSQQIVVASWRHPATKHTKAKAKQRAMQSSAQKADAHEIGKTMLLRLLLMLRLLFVCAVNNVQPKHPYY
jgi:hypothetical protein